MDTQLEELVRQYNTLSLPGQPKFVHMGTLNLINALWQEIEFLRKEVSDKDRLLDLRDAAYHRWWLRGIIDEREVR